MPLIAVTRPSGLRLSRWPLAARCWHRNGLIGGRVVGRIRRADVWPRSDGECTVDEGAGGACRAHQRPETDAVGLSKPKIRHTVV